MADATEQFKGFEPVIPVDSSLREKSVDFEALLYDNQ